MPKETFARLRKEKQERVMRAAISEFNKSGFASTTVDDIALAAGIAKGSVYQYFTDKRDLFLYCADWGLEMFMEKLTARSPLADMDVFEYFEERTAKGQVIDEEREMTMFLHQMSREPLLSAESMRRMYEVSDKYICELIENSVKKGLVRSDLEPALIKEFFIGVTERIKMRWMNLYFDFTNPEYVSNPEELAKELSQMIELLKRGMGC